MKQIGDVIGVSGGIVQQLYNIIKPIMDDLAINKHKRKKTEDMKTATDLYDFDPDTGEMYVVKKDVTKERKLVGDLGIGEDVYGSTLKKDGKGLNSKIKMITVKKKYKDTPQNRELGRVGKTYEIKQFASKYN